MDAMRTCFRGYHPAVCIFYFASVLIFGMLFRHPVTLFLGFAAAFCCYVRLYGSAAVRSFFSFLLPMLFFSVLLNGLFAHYGVTPLLTLPDGNSLTFEALVNGFALGLSAVTAILWFFCFNAVVDSDGFLSVFAGLLPTAALIVCMALRFIPLYKNRLGVISDARRGIGTRSENNGMTAKLKTGAKNLSVLTTWALENAVDTSDAMRARGYGLSGRSTYGKYTVNSKDRLTSGVILLTDAALLAGYLTKALYTSYNPCVIINPPGADALFREELNLTLYPFSRVGILTLAAFALLCLLPPITNLREEIKWNRSLSKI